MRKHLFQLSLMIAVVFFACQKDTSQFIEKPSDNYKSNIFGRVVDEENQPIAEATVKLGNKITSTDLNGVYYFKNIEINSIHSFLTIEKEGYFQGSRGFNTQQPNKTLNLYNVLLKKNFNQTFASSQGGEVRDNELKIVFKPDAIVYDETNLDYNGQVHVAVKYLDASTEKIYSQMPGNLSAINQENDIVTLLTFGMLAVELRADDGRKLNLKKDHPSTIALELSPKLLATAPNSIPLWYFDSHIGMWIEEGKATLENGVYSGEVTHFSWWNYDAPYPSITLSSRIVDIDLNPIPNAHIRFVVQGEYNGSSGITNSDGTFSGLVPKDKILVVIISFYHPGGSCGTIQSVYQLGPFSDDMNIPDIIVNSIDYSSYEIIGNYLNCDNEPITNGYVKLFDEDQIFAIYPIENGEAEINFLYCNDNLELELVAIDKESFEESNPIVVAGEGEHMLADVLACGVQTDYIIFQSITYPFLDTLLQVSLFDSISSLSKKSIYASYEPNQSLEYLIIFFDDLQIDGFQAGTYNLLSGRFHVINGQGTNLSTGEYELQNGTITIENSGNSGDRMKATFQFFAQNTSWGEISEFEGSLNIMYNN